MTGGIPVGRRERHRLPEDVVYTVLGNERRRRALEALRERPSDVTLRDLSERIASHETGEEPAPRDVRDSVYGSLHQTHLPTLDRHGLIEYDQDRKVVHPRPATRDLGPYLEVRAMPGVTWVGLFQWLGILGLFLLVGSLGGLPGLRLLPPLIVGSIFLAGFAVTSAVRLRRVRRRAGTTASVRP